MGESTRDSSILDRSFVEEFVREIRERDAFSSHESETRIFEEEETEVSNKGNSSLRTVQVYLRLKPFSSRIKLDKEHVNAYSLTSPTTLLTRLSCLKGNARHSRKPRINRETISRRFTFTRAFGPETSQVQLFDQTVKQLMADLLTGQSATVMSYGTANAGKTYTLLGTWSSPGIIPRSIRYVFANIGCTSSPWYKPIRRNDIVYLDKTAQILEVETRNKLLSSRSIDRDRNTEVYRLLENLPGGDRDNWDGTVYSVWLSFIEIYNETVYDLLADDNRGNNLPLKLATDVQGVTFVKGLTMMSATTAADAYRIFLAGQSRLSVGSTEQSSTSSRSHSIFTIKLLKYSREQAADEVETSAVAFCDLAGSGRPKRTLNAGKRLKEAQSINTSLLVLGRCLKAVLEGQSTKQNVQVVGSFRESKLTRLFQRALSGKEPLCFIVNVDPSPDQYVPTQSILNLSAIARRITVEPVKDVGRSSASSMILRSSRTSIDWNATKLPSLASISERGNHLDVPEDYDQVRERNDKLERTIAALKGSTLNREYEIRREMASFCTGKLKNLDTDWRNYTKEMEEQREDLLKWSVRQVENFYEGRIDRMNNRKRRRTGEDDCCNDDGAIVEELEMENARLISTVVSLKEAVKNFREDDERLETEKNKCTFELALAKKELGSLRSLIRGELGDGPNSEGTESLVGELKMLISGKDDVSGKLRDSLGKVKQEYLRAIVDVEKVEVQLADARTVLAATSAKTKDLEEELEYSNAYLSQKTDYVQVLQEQLEVQRKRLIEADAMTREVDDKWRKSEARAASLTKRLEKLETILRENDIDLERYALTELEKNGEREALKFRDSTREYSAAETEDSLLEEESSETESKLSSRSSKLQDIENADVREQYELEKALKDTTIETPDRTSFLVSIGKLNQTYRSSSGDNSKDDSGIAISADGSVQTYNARSTGNSVKVETEDKSCQTNYLEEESCGQIREKIKHLKLDYTELRAKHLQETSRILELCRELESVKSMVQILRNSSSSNAPKIEEEEDRSKPMTGERDPESASATKQREMEDKLTEMSRTLGIKIQEYESEIEGLKNRLEVSEENENRTSKRLEECLGKSSSLENQLSAVCEQLQKTSVKCFTEHVPKMDKLDKLFSKKWPADEMDGAEMSQVERGSVRLTELSREVRRFESILERCQRGKDDLRRELRERSEKQSHLECSLATLTESIRERENEILSLRAELEEVVRTNATNGKLVKELSEEIADALKRLAGAKEEARKKLERTPGQEMGSLQVRLTAFEKRAALANAICENEEYGQDELDRLKIQLHEKRREIIKFLRRHGNRTILRYEFLTRQLRMDGARITRTLVKPKGSHSKRIVYKITVTGKSGKNRKAKGVSVGTKGQPKTESNERFDLGPCATPQQSRLGTTMNAMKERRSIKDRRLLPQIDETCIDLEPSQTKVKPELHSPSTECPGVSRTTTSSICTVDDSYWPEVRKEQSTKNPV